VLLACSEKSPTGIPLIQPEKGDLLASVTGRAAAALDASGKFKFVNQSAAQHSEITSGEANDLASVWVHEFGPLHLRFLQETHGAPINFHTLTKCGRTLYVRNAFTPPSADIPSPYLRPYGPWWLVTMCAQGVVPTVSVAVSAWATELTISNGSIQFPRASGGEFFGIGIPLGQVGEFPSSPEAAATFAAKESGMRVADVPELIMSANTDGPPQAARWHMKLDKQAKLLGKKSGALTVSDVFVGSPQTTKLGIALYVASPDQPSRVEFRWSVLPELHEQWKAYQQRMYASTKTASAMRLIDTPARFEIATAAGGQ